MIENGIDMPNVNTILVIDADRCKAALQKNHLAFFDGPLFLFIVRIVHLFCHRFGISALYQLRGRVGRSTRQAYAYFLTTKTSLTVEAETRLTYIKVELSLEIINTPFLNFSFYVSTWFCIADVYCPWLWI